MAMAAIGTTTPMATLAFSSRPPLLLPEGLIGVAVGVEDDEVFVEEAPLTVVDVTTLVLVEPWDVTVTLVVGGVLVDEGVLEGVDDGVVLEGVDDGVVDEGVDDGVDDGVVDEGVELGVVDEGVVLLEGVDDGVVDEGVELGVDDGWVGEETLEGEETLVGS